MEPVNLFFEVSTNMRGVGRYRVPALGACPACGTASGQAPFLVNCVKFAFQNIRTKKHEKCKENGRVRSLQANFITG
jgi:hypothetical protein